MLSENTQSAVLASKTEQAVEETISIHNDENTMTFIPSRIWLGEKKGFYFGTGNKGTGYYVDSLQQQQDGQISKKRKKSVRIAEDQNEMKLLLEELEKKAAGYSILELSKKGVHAASKSLANVYKQNIRKRAEYPKKPEHYMDSELALYEQITALQALATDTQVYRYIESSNLMLTLVQLLGHENTDICASVVSLLLEWIDPSLVTEDRAVLPFLGSFAAMTMEGWERVVLNLDRFQNDEESQDKNLKGVDNTLELMENILELDGLLAPDGILGKEKNVHTVMARDSMIVSWLFTTIENESELQNKDELLVAKCVELLSLLSQNIDVFFALPDWSKFQSTTNDNILSGKKRKKNQIDGIETLLQFIAVYRKKQPKSDVEIEILENSCITLSSCISFSTSNISAFLNGQGVELVIRCLKEKMHAGGSSLKLLDFFGDDEVYKSAAEKLVIAGGLKYLFPIFVGFRIPKPAIQASRSIKAKRKWLTELKAQVIRILYALSFQLDRQSPEDAMSRFVAKFVEDDLKYCDRLVELLLEYDERKRKAEYNFFRSDIEDTLDADQVAFASFEAKLNGGGDICYRLAAITAFICVNSKRCHERIFFQLKMQQSGVSLIKDAMNEFALSLENGRQKRHIESLMGQI
uniref:Beta-catenin-like protein 1 N-terminal domain-containing protein n=1 Tax=Pseudo-nitzschia australis TaxID=44445 RepID=A0A6U9XVP6_9STRA|mmetsp:Transcript_13649/g.28621  ORF Transcript_13649/g.28621 Transcript_13649/m.28621 type:complete len:638 (-) Transcript_13649:1839-3752(-)